MVGGSGGWQWWVAVVGGGQWWVAVVGGSGGWHAGSHPMRLCAPQKVQVFPGNLLSNDITFNSNLYSITRRKNMIGKDHRTS